MKKKKRNKQQKKQQQKKKRRKKKAEKCGAAVLIMSATCNTVHAVPIEQDCTLLHCKPASVPLLLLALIAVAHALSLQIAYPQRLSHLHPCRAPFQPGLKADTHCVLVKLSSSIHLCFPAITQNGSK